MTYNVFGGTLSLTQSINQAFSAAADLGMFSMFSRTGAPTKGAVIFYMPEKWATLE